MNSMKEGLKSFWVSVGKAAGYIAMGIMAVLGIVFLWNRSRENKKEGVTIDVKKKNQGDHDKADALDRDIDILESGGKSGS